MTASRRFFRPGKLEVFANCKIALVLYLVLVYSLSCVLFSGAVQAGEQKGSNRAHSLGHEPGNQYGVTSAVSDGNHSAVKSAVSDFDDKYAIVVGVDSFSDPSMNTALAIVESAAKVRKSLLASDFSDDHVRMLLNKQATRQAILTSIAESWLPKLSDDKDLVVIFLAMQCFPANDGNVYLLPYDTDAHNFFATAIDANVLVRLVEEKVKAKRIVLVFDTSFSGAPEMMAGCKARFARYNFAPSKNSISNRLAVVVSSKATQPTWGTYFSDNLARLLADCHGREPLTELFSRVRRATINDTIKDCAGCKLQTPEIYGKGAALSTVIGGKGTQPRQLNEEAVSYMQAEEICAETQALVDECEAKERSRAASGAGTANGTIASGTQSDTKDPASANANLSPELQKAIGVLQTAIRNHPHFAPLHFLLGRLLECAGQNKDASQSYEEAVRLAPEESLYRSQLAQALDRVGLDSDEQWKAAYRLNNKNLDALDSLALRAGEEKHIERAIDYLEQALSLYPGDAGLHVRLSDVLKRSGKMKQAIAHAEEAVFIDNRSFDALVNLGVLLMANKDDKGAHDAFRQALEVGSSDGEDYYFLARELEKTNDASGAIKALERFIAASRKDDNRLNEAKSRLDNLKKRPLQ